MRYVEVEDLASYLHRELEDGDALAHLACDAATEVVAEYIDQNVTYATDTAKLSGDGKNDALMLPQYPVLSVSMVSEATPQSITAATFITTAGTFTIEGHGYEVDDLVYVSGVTPTVYNGTWTVDSVTDDTFEVTLDATPGGVGTAFGTARLALDPDEYELGNAGILYRISDNLPLVWAWGNRNILVEYTSGYLDPDDINSVGAPNLPKTVSLVALQIAARVYDVGMVETESTGSYSVNYVKGAGTLTSLEKDILSHHRLEV